MALWVPFHCAGRERQPLSREAGEEGTSNDSPYNVRRDLYQVELRWRDLLDLEEHYTSAAVSF